MLVYNLKRKSEGEWGNICGNIMAIGMRCAVKLILQWNIQSCWYYTKLCMYIPNIKVYETLKNVWTHCRFCSDFFWIKNSLDNQEVDSPVVLAGLTIAAAAAAAPRLRYKDPVRIFLLESNTSALSFENPFWSPDGKWVKPFRAENGWSLRSARLRSSSGKWRPG